MKTTALIIALLLGLVTDSAWAQSSAAKPKDKAGSVPETSRTTSTAGPTYVIGADDTLHIDVWKESIVGRDKNETFVEKRLRLGLDACLVTCLPSSTVNPKNYGQTLRVTRRINVEHLTLMSRSSVAYIALHLLSLRPSQKHKNDQKKTEYVLHGLSAYGT